MRLASIGITQADWDRTIERVKAAIVRDFTEYQRTRQPKHPGGSWRVQDEHGEYFGGAYGSRPDFTNPSVSLVCNVTPTRSGPKAASANPW